MLGRAQHGPPERMIAEHGFIDQVLGHDRGLIVRAGDLLDHNPALAVHLLGIEPGLGDEIGQQVGGLEAALGPRGDVKGDQIVAGVGVEYSADPLRRLVDGPVGRILLTPLEDQMLEEVSHPVLLVALGARAGVEGDENC